MNLIFCAYAYISDYKSGNNLSLSDKNKEIYLKNCLVALASAKKFNQEDCVALFTNIELNQSWEKMFSKHSIMINYVPFDDFILDKSYGWSLAFYKLCALNKALELDYDNYVLIDSDTYTQREYVDIWEECKNSILLYDISRGLYNKDYKVFVDEAKDYLKQDDILTRWGGEFIAGNKENLADFMRLCSTVYADMKNGACHTINGDEFITSIAAYHMRNKVKNASAYVFRYWTAYHWHYVCSNYRNNPVCVLHCPREKNHGFIHIYNYLFKHDLLPNNNKIYRMLHLNTFSYIKLEIIRSLLKGH